MKLPFLPPPTREELRTRPIHELVRDYPELLVVLDFPAGSEAETGWELLSEADGSGSLVSEVSEVLAWRKSV